MAFRLSSTSNGSATLDLSGEVDMADAASLEAQLIGWVKESEGPVRVNVANLRFIDSTGLRALVNVYQAASDREITITLENPTPTVARVLAVTRLDQVLLDPG